MTRRGPKKWKWFSEPIGAECRGCRMRWDSWTEVYQLGACPGCGYTPEDAREADRQRRAGYRAAAATPKEMRNDD
jgi:hypothetical protein